MRPMTALLLLFSVLVTLSARAQDPVTTFLLPVFVDSDDPIPGAHGSQWVTHLTMTNRGPEHVRLSGFYVCPGTAQCPPAPPLPAGATVNDPSDAHQTASLGHLFQTEGDVSQVDFVLRAQDVSRQSHTWGTTIPVVRQDEFVTDEIGLSDITVTPEFRSLLRVYDLDPRGEGSVIIRIYSSDDDLLAEHLVRLTYGAHAHYEPGYGEFAFDRPELVGHDRVRVTVTSDSEGLRFWAFAAVTNNETQHLTVITPTHR